MTYTKRRKQLHISASFHAAEMYYVFSPASSMTWHDFGIFIYLSLIHMEEHNDEGTDAQKDL